MAQASVEQALPIESAAPSIPKKVRRQQKLKRIFRNKYLYLMILPGLVYFLIFKYVPMWGLIIAFQDYQPFLGVTGSEWVGFKHFERLFTEPTFFQLLRNTLVLFLYNLIFFFPVPIILAVLLNEIRLMVFKRFVQTMIYIPHFMSWVIVVSLTYVLFTTDGGVINEIIYSITGKNVNFLMSEDWFRPLYILQVIWREAGWATIIYFAAIAAIDPSLYEAAKMDGANRFRQIWHITLPAIRSVIVVLLILKIGDILELGFEHVFLMLNAMNREVAEIFDTYVYTAGLKEGQFSYSTAVGFFKSIVGLIMVMLANWLAKKFGEEGVY
ncbi:sugar ABC transporter permease [Halalkalibacterium halodurans]|jgi:putative aldouronate transport system permease protein|uniref:Transmembrane lipoprotein n=2 Tax=Halalkalibacterium halodurans TaxID=86665 RepID=Q9KFJ5_HALH5|nr:sugar ABC transporter permease [Halalkalibacterium halodurans]MDY7220982.1 sugar ABC transporter permease [Halalkalibacterium halodurans]MDY7240221.1 sugar ABC transporter permease [Halalkalibacterium halodurans]MED3647646.1 sugar ABC transporter permease [Halalkalibacterium halodurans]MED4079872.1 sugar ABC transporter permease [Halalkalibacterium halodurans]MED4085309.1 sugar ABC transporter permease [Halalkalibacterium halodurans]